MCKRIPGGEPNMKFVLTQCSLNSCLRQLAEMIKNIWLKIATQSLIRQKDLFCTVVPMCYNYNLSKQKTKQNKKKQKKQKTKQNKTHKQTKNSKSNKLSLKTISNLWLTDLSRSCPGLSSVKVAATAEGSPLLSILDEPSGICQRCNSSCHAAFLAAVYPAFRWTSFGSCSPGRAKQCD